MVVWEAVQKENYLSKLEKQRRDSDGEVLRRTAHRCAPPRASAARCGRPPPQAGSDLGKLRLRGQGRVRLSGTGQLVSRP